MSTEIALRNEAVPALVEEPAVLASRAPDPMAAIEFASQCASLLKGVLVRQQLITRIQGKDHVNAEGWTLLAAMTGYSPRVAWSRKVDPGIGDGWEACVELVDSFGRVCSAAEAMALKDEGAKWSRQEYSVRSMAQTRATSRAIRLKLGYIVTMAGYSATAAEEMPSDAHPSATPGIAPPARGRHAGGAPADQRPASSATSPGAPPAAGTQGAVVDPRPATTAPLSPGKAQFLTLMEELGIENNRTNRTHAIAALTGHKITSDVLTDEAKLAEAREALRVAFAIARTATQVVEVPSEKDPAVKYKVELTRHDDDADARCECESFKFNGLCKHQSTAWAELGLGDLVDPPIPLAPWEGIDLLAHAKAASAAYEEAFPEAAAKRNPRKVKAEEDADRAWEASEPKEAA